MSDDKSKNKSKPEVESDANESSEGIGENLSSRISDVFDEENDKTIVDEVHEKGEEIADTVAGKTEEVIDGVSEIAKELAGDVAIVATAVHDVAEDVKDAVVHAAEDAKDAVVHAVDDTKHAIDEVFGNDGQTPVVDESEGGDGEVKGIAAYFNHPDHLMYAAEQARDADFEIYDAYSPFPIHGMDDAMGLERSWIPWVTFGAGVAGFSTAFGIQFGIMGFDWPMVFGGRPFIAWPSFVPILFELTVLFAGVTTAIVMLFAAGCFRKPFIIDKDITNDQFVLWISADDKAFDIDDVIAFMKKLNPHTIRAVREGHK